MRYTKMHGAGNSFVLIEDPRGELRGEDADASRVAHETVLKAEAREASCPVAAHLARRAVGVVKEHPEILFAPRRRHDDQAVRARARLGRA